MKDVQYCLHSWSNRHERHPRWSRTLSNRSDWIGLTWLCLTRAKLLVECLMHLYIIYFQIRISVWPCWSLVFKFGFIQVVAAISMDCTFYPKIHLFLLVHWLTKHIAKHRCGRKPYLKSSHWVVRLSDFSQEVEHLVTVEACRHFCRKSSCF